MIRKIFMTGFSMLLALPLLVKAQCIPDTTLKTDGFAPSSLPNATVNVAYSQSISVRTPHDTTVVFMGNTISARIDSIKATAVKGMPSGFSYQCQHPRCVFLWDTTRCVEILGTTQQGGVYPLKIMVTYYALLGGSFYVAQKDSIQKFTLTVDGGTTAVIDNTKQDLFAFPNPVSGKLFISGASAKVAKDISISDMKGAMQKVNIYADGGLWVADLGGLSAGIYLVRTNFGVKQIEVLGK